jgi:hypothetical protein
VLHFLNQANKQKLGESHGEEENGKEKGKELTVQYGTHYMIFVGALIRYTYTLSPNGMIEYEQTTFRRARGNRICVVEIE